MFYIKLSKALKSYLLELSQHPTVFMNGKFVSKISASDILCLSVSISLHRTHLKKKMAKIEYIIVTE